MSTYRRDRDGVGSLIYYGTVVFGLEQMRELIKLPENGFDLALRRLSAARWFELMPEAYRMPVLGVLEDWFRDHADEKFCATDEDLERFTLDVHERIWRLVEPVASESVR